MSDLPPSAWNLPLGVSLRDVDGGICHCSECGRTFEPQDEDDTTCPRCRSLPDTDHDYDETP